MNRRKFLKAGSVVGIAATTSLVLSNQGNSLSWDLVDVDSKKHMPNNHIYKLLSLVSKGIDVDNYKYTKRIFQVGVDKISVDKVYEKNFSPGIVTWCNTADYEIIKDLDFTNFISIGIVHGMMDPTQLRRFPVSSCLDGYEVHFLFRQ